MALGAAIFGLFGVLQTPSDDGGRRIVVGGEEIESLWQTMSLLSGQAPTEADLRQLLEPRIREEVLYREALALGLDRDDAQIRQRLVEKMTFLSDDLLPAQPPTDAELAAYFAAHRDAFEEPARVTFEQIYFSPGEHGAAILDAAEAALQVLERGGEGAAASAGHASVAARGYEAATAAELRADLGEEFAAAVLALPADGAWHGPIRSLFGVHLVRPTERVPARSPPLAEIRDRVAAAFEEARRRRANEAAYRELRSRYEIVVEIPETVRDAWQSE